MPVDWLDKLRQVREESGGFPSYHTPRMCPAGSLIINLLVCSVKSEPMVQSPSEVIGKWVGLGMEWNL